MKPKKLFNLVIMLLSLPFISGCWMIAAAGAGAYGGYKMKENGYTVQNPITKENQSEDSAK